MHLISKIHLQRRTFLRGLGASLGLPLLDAMVPALTAQSRTAALPIRRMGFVYVPHGAIMDKFTPATTGSQFEFSPILKPLEAYRDHVVVVSGLDHKNADNAGVHSFSPTTWLSGVRPKETKGEARAGVTADQIAAARIGQSTPLPSLETATEDHASMVGACDGGYSCTYINTLSWKTDTTPLPMEINPRVIFERMFGDGGTPDQIKARIQQDRSILDAVTQQAKKLSMTVGSSDRHTLGQYLENVREIERRIQIAETNLGVDEGTATAPLGIPDAFEDHAKLMFDLQVLAFQADMTRVSTFMMARELSQRIYPQVGSRDPHHSLSHHEDNPIKIDTLVRVQTYHVQMFAHFLERLRSTPDGDGSLLDHSMILYGSNMSNSNLHNHFPLPVVVAGGCGGQLQGNRHLKYPDRTPMANLLMTMLGKVDIAMESLGDSTGPLTDF